ncbi:MAG: hypothetical protein D6722_13880 [Bacteroidetes bacterium]|nr:MAG: hypothetical protein D6722_13880 [Bacteroidota bacterium]
MQLIPKILLLGLLCTGFSAQLQATIFRINNQTGTPDGSNGIYEQPLAAHNDAFTGDTLLFDGSPDAYNSFMVTKRLVIMGPGYFQDENPNTNIFSAQIGRITLSPDGSTSATGAAGSIVQGMDMGDAFPGEIIVNVNDVLIRKNRLNEVDINGSTNPAFRATGVVISQNFFAGQNEDHFGWSSFDVLQGIVVRNNIFEGKVEVPDFSQMHFFNNIFLNQQFDIQNLLGTVRNNVFFSTNATYNLSADSITHNISMGSGLPAGNSNILNANPGQIFVLNAGVNGSDGQYRLKANSIAQGAGFNGADIGPYGGVSPYVRYGYGEMPVIWQMSTAGVIDPGDLLQVSIKAVSEN